MTIQENLLKLGAQYGRPGTKMSPKGIVVHYVGNPGSSALSNRNYFEQTGVASCHYIVGLSGEVLRIIPDNEVAWHAGRSFGPQWDVQARKNNFMYIGIETCHPDPTGKFNWTTYNALITLCASLCKQYGWDPSKDVFRHYDVCGKNCPLYYVKYPSEWAKMRNDIAVLLSGPDPSDSPEAHKTPIIGKATATAAQMKDWARASGAAPFFADLADTFYKVSVDAGVDPAVTYCQSAKETGYGKFGGVLDASYCNPCGMKTKEGGGDYDKEAHQRFATWEDGISAQVDHLALYAGAAGYPKARTRDPRHFASIKGKAPTVEELGGNWAPSKTYGNEIAERMKQLRAAKAAKE